MIISLQMHCKCLRKQTTTTITNLRAVFSRSLVHLVSVCALIAFVVVGVVVVFVVVAAATWMQPQRCAIEISRSEISLARSKRLERRSSGNYGQLFTCTRTLHTRASGEPWALALSQPTVTPTTKNHCNVGKLACRRQISVLVLVFRGLY